MQTSKDKNIINVKSMMPAAAKIWASMLHLLLYGFIWLFFSSSVYAFTIYAPTNDYLIANGYLEKPIIYRDSVRDVQIVSILTQVGDEYESLTIFPVTDKQIGESRIVYNDAIIDGVNVAVQTELSLPKILTIKSAEQGKGLEMLRYPLSPDQEWEQDIKVEVNIDPNLIPLSLPPMELHAKTTVKEETIDVPAGRFETLHVKTRAEGTVHFLLGDFQIVLRQEFWLDKITGIFIKTFHQIEVTGISFGPFGTELALPIEKQAQLIDPTQMVIVPDYGNPTGGTEILIVGDGFTEETIVTFVIEPEPVTKSVKFDDDTGFYDGTGFLITKTPDRVDTGAATVQVIANTNGTILVGQFTYAGEMHPTIEEIEPLGGPPTGGTSITITGDGFNTGTMVTIGGIPLLDKQVFGTTKITGITPPGETGAQVVIVANGDLEFPPINNGFRYAAAPTVESIEPFGGNRAGSTEIIITGTGFQEDTKTFGGKLKRLIVTVGSSEASDIQVFANGTQIKAKTPPGDFGPQKVVITNPDGQSSQEDIAYIYNPPPKVTKIFPEIGTFNTPITLEGENFIPKILDKSLMVTISGVPVDEIEFVKSEEIKFTAPDIQLLGDVSVIVINPDGQQAETTFNYIPRPKVQSISPPSGKLAGDTKVTIKGTGFVEQIGEQRIQVEFDGISVVPDADVEFVSSNEIKVTTPKRQRPGAVTIIVKNPDKQQAEGTFTYNPFPKITSLSPPSGNPNVITTVTITGEHFIERISGMPNRIQVSIDSRAIADDDIQFLSANTVRIFAPTSQQSQPGTARIIVTNPDGQQSQEKVEYVYNPLPRVTSILPEIGTVGTPITLEGENFIPKILDKSLTVTIGGIPVVEIEPVTSNEIKFTAPDIGLLGDVSIIVTNPDGQQAGTTFNYIPRPKVESISPASGRLDGGTKVTIKGTGFVEQIGKQRIQVEFEGISLAPDADVEFVSSNEMKVTTPKKQTPGMVYVIVTNPDGWSSEKSEDATFTYNPPSTIASIFPPSGRLAGGTEITITGEYFIQDIPGETRQLTVTIGGTAAESVFLVSNQKLLVTTPERPEPGEFEVIVINPDGQQAKGTFTYNPPPKITNISPPSGKLDGGTKITITGENFIEKIPGMEAQLTVMIGGVATAKVQFISAQELNVITSVYTTSGEVDIIITNPDGQQAKGTFVYNPVPTITSILPSSGELAGGTEINITGTGFIQEIPGVKAKLAITIGGVAAESVQFISEGELSFTTPAFPNSGTVEVIVTNPDEQQSEAIFTYNPFPNVISISPPSGNPNVITSVTITGEHFIERIPRMPNRIQVSIGSIQIADKDIQFLSSNTLRIFAPKSQPGTARIIVTNPDGQQSQENVEYVYNPPPKVTNISPVSGTVDTKITITGENFIENILAEFFRVTIGGFNVDKNSIDFVNSTKIQFPAPDIKPFGGVPVIIINPDGQQAAGTFTYNAIPTITSISPESGKLAGGTKITITGTGFIEQIDERRIKVEFEGISVAPDADIVFVSPEELIVSTPKNESPDTVAVIITNPDGQSSEKSQDATFMYNPFPKIESITGEHFIQDILGEERQLTVTIGGTTAESVFFVSNQKLLVTTPARPELGEFEVIVINPDGQQTKGVFTYNPLPTVTNISPPSGKLAGDTKITITGENFIEEIPGMEAQFTVTIGGVTAEKVQFISSQELHVTTPASTTSGEVDVIVTNPDGQYAKGLFVYNPIPTITGIFPPSGELAGGTEITITGTGFIQEIPGVEAKLAITIGGVAAEKVRFISSTQLTAITPNPDRPGEIALIITNPDGQQAEGTYTYNPLPTVTSISPPSGKLAGETKITITGTGVIEQILDKRLSIQFGDVDVTANIESILNTQIVLTTPASPEPKTLDVIITNPDGQETSTKFTYNPFPIASSITPDRGTISTPVTISGSNFIEKISDQYISLKVGDVSVEKINFVSSGEITFEAPIILESGSFPIIVINPDGQESQQVINFTYNPAPTITNIIPSRGRMDGSTGVILKGTGFICEEIPALGKIQVKIGNKSLEVECSPTELRFTTPPSSGPGEIDVIVINPDGQQAKGNFTYTPAPIVLDVIPKIGTPEGDTKITIKGENFLEDILGQSIRVTIGGREAEEVSRRSDTEITARTPPAATPDSVVPVIVIGPDRQRSSEIIKFTYNDLLRISGISPNMGSPGGGTEVTISGTGFTEEIPFNVWFGDVEVKEEDIEVVSPKRLIIRTPPGDPGAVVDVSIENDDRQEYTLKNDFQYTEKLVTSSMSPRIGPVKGGTEVVITGWGFIPQIGEQKIEVTFGGKPGVIVSVAPTKLIVRTPPGALNTNVEVIVTGPDGQKVILGDRFHFHYIDFPEGVLVYNYPNPTPVGRGTIFRFRDSSGSIEIKIFNMAGMLVQNLPGNGGNIIPWDGKDRFGNVTPFGLYPYVYLVDGVVKQGQLLHIHP